MNYIEFQRTRKLMRTNIYAYGDRDREKHKHTYMSVYIFEKHRMLI